MATKKTEQNKEDPAQGFYRPRVIIKFRDQIGLPYDESAASKLESLGVGSWPRLAEQFRGISLVPLFASKKQSEIQELVDRAMKMDPTYRPPDFFSYFAVDIPLEVEAKEVEASLANWQSVEVTYVEPPPVVPPAVNPADDPRSVNQGYLDPAPDGIDAEYAWGFPGGAGAGQALVDLEVGWNFNHEDLSAHNIKLISGLNHAFFYHGTAVLGEIAAADNSVGCVGITPEIGSVRCVSQYLSGGGVSTSQPILDAIAVMSFGDVLLLEAQTNLYGYVGVPSEIEPAVFAATRLATALGIVVVEAAGNGGKDLDAVVNPAGEQIFNRASPDFLDSGAIMVGAATSTVPHSRVVTSCYGSRIDCYGWGENVNTLSSHDANTPTNLYTNDFARTSAASGIVAGAALAVQGLAQANLMHRLGPWQLRAILSDPANGTASQAPKDRIGVMPNLRAIIDGNVLNLAPDVYLRDFVGDTGDPHNSPISASPDVILRPSPVRIPQKAFGQGSGTENDVNLSFQAEAGQDNFIYVRIRNRGGSPATNVNVAVYWSPVSTLVTPDMWTLVGTTSLDSVPTGNQLTVSNAITWAADDIPAAGHYCFVGLIGNNEDPAPIPADLFNLDKFRLFIRNNNNVTWRNFSVVDNTSLSESLLPEFVSLPFQAAGAPDRARSMGFEVVGHLPEGARAFLEMPREFAHLLKAQPVSVEGEQDDRSVYVPVNPRGITRFDPVPFSVKTRIPMRLLVHIPKALREHEFDIYARQLYEGEEIGRVTWRLAPPREPIEET